MQRPAHKKSWRTHDGYRSVPLTWFARTTAYAGAGLVAYLTLPTSPAAVTVAVQVINVVVPLTFLTVLGLISGYLVRIKQVSHLHGIVALAALSLGFLLMELNELQHGLHLAVLVALYLLESVNSHYEAYGNKRIPLGD